MSYGKGMFRIDFIVKDTAVICEKIQWVLVPQFSGRLLPTKT